MERSLTRERSSNRLLTAAKAKKISILNCLRGRKTCVNCLLLPSFPPHSQGLSSLHPPPPPSEERECRNKMLFALFLSFTSPEGLPFFFKASGVFKQQRRHFVIRVAKGMQGSRAPRQNWGLELRWCTLGLHLPRPGFK